MSIPHNNQAYRNFLQDIKYKIQQAQTRAVFVVNTHLINLYWSIGKEILARQNAQKWGTKVVQRLSEDLKNAFPDLKGFSRRNLMYMRQFAENYPDFEFVQAPLAQMSWYHNIALLEKCNDHNQRLWYAQKTLENGWSRNIMVMHIESNLYERQGKPISNFDKTLPKYDSELVQQTLKDPYIFDFLQLADDTQERGIEKALIDNISKFLLELGRGFAFIGQQYHLEIGKEDFYVDLLFYHTQLHCYVVVELKTGKFKPEYAGKLNFYLSAVDSLLRDVTLDAPTIGILLCREKNEVIVEYALKDMEKPIGVANYTLGTSLPHEVKEKLPSVEELEARMKDISQDQAES
jgi:predicted nuclease of restriction endonuclease-like (RecB) superfamily